MYENVIFFDLDGTLLNSKNEISESVLECINLLKQNNNLPVIATGRSISESELFLNQCSIDSMISMNGSLVLYKNDVIESKNIPSELCEKMLSFINESEDALTYFSEDNSWTTSHNDLFKKVFLSLGIEFPKIEKKAYLNQNILSMVLCTNKSQSELESNLPELEFFKVSPYSYDIVLKGVNKGEGVKRFMENLPNTNTFAFGDGENDISLFDACDVSIAMGNAVENLKKKADFITKSNDLDGIKKGLIEFKLI